MSLVKIEEFRVCYTRNWTLQKSSTISKLKFKLNCFVIDVVGDFISLWNQWNGYFEADD